MLKKLLSLCLAVLFLVPVSAETFSYSGGSGRVSIVCDGVESREDGAYAAIRFVSNNHSKTDYRYVRIGEDKYYPDENGQFVIPVVLGENMEIVGMTAKMSAPHEITYTIFVQLEDTDIPGLTFVSAIQADASYLTLAKYEGGIVLASIVPPEGFEAAQFRYLLTEDASTIPAGLEKDYGVSPVPAESTVTIADCEALEAPDYKSMIRGKVTVVILDAALLTEENRSAYETLRDRLNTLGIPLLLDRSAQEADSSTWDVLWNIINP